LMKRNVTVTGLWLSSLMPDAELTRQAAQALTPLVASGQVTPQIGPTYGLAESARAFQDILDRKTTGKVIIEPGR
ncbi:zinc-binding dehydrogenase, partial [uncultured Deinococcus sp.]